MRELAEANAEEEAFFAEFYAADRRPRYRSIRFDIIGNLTDPNSLASQHQEKLEN